MEQKQPAKNAQQGNKSMDKKDMKMDRKNYPDTTEQRLNEAKETRDDLYGKSSKDSSKK